jgi:hypothetical protein
MKKVKLNSTKLQLMKQEIASLSADEMAGIMGGSATNPSTDPETPTCHYTPSHVCSPAITISCETVCGPSCDICNG